MTLYKVMISTVFECESYAKIQAVYSFLLLNDFSMIDTYENDLIQERRLDFF